MMLWAGFGIVSAALIGVDVRKNPQSYRNIGLRFGDGCRNLWFWPARLSSAHGYVGRHRFGDPIPDFMRHWQPPRPWRS